MALIGEMQYLTIGGNTYSISAGAKTFIVTLTESNGTYTSDKTAEEIYTAFNAGDTVLLDCGSYILLSSVYGEDGYYQADFYKSEASTGSFHKYQYIITTDNGTTSVDYTDYKTPVNNATLTIQKNGTTVNSFTANASSDVTANVTVPTKVSELTNDSGYITGYTETDPTVPSWAKQSTKPSYTASEVGAVPTSRTVNGKALSSNITLSASDVSALPSSTIIPTITDTYSGTSSNGMSGKAVKSAIDALDGTITGSAGAGKTLTAFSQTDGKVSATFGDISITKSQISDFPTIPDVSGKIDTAGTGLSKSGTTLNHSNSVTAQTTQAVYPIKIDAQGHISEYGNAVTIPTVNDATLTIQKNGVNIETFSANATSNKTANIVVNEVPSGGTSGQVLTKHSATNYDVEWADASAGAFIVTFTYNDQNETWSCDKTAQEIYEAYQSGSAVIGYEIYENDEDYEYDGYAYYLYRCSMEGDEPYAQFTRTLSSEQGQTVESSVFEVDSSGVIAEFSALNILPPFVAQYGVTTYADVKYAYDRGATVICTIYGEGIRKTLQLNRFDEVNHIYYFVQSENDGYRWASIANDNTWSQGVVDFALSSEVPTKTSDLTNDSGFINSIKTINNQSLIGSGDITVSTTAAQIIRWTESA